MKRRDVFRSAATLAAGLMISEPLLAARPNRRRLIVLADPAIDASQRFAALCAGESATVVELSGNRLLAWHRDIAPGLDEHAIVGLTSASDAQFFSDAAREAGLRLDTAWLHRRQRDGRFRHVALGARPAGASVRALERRGDHWLGLAAALAGGLEGASVASAAPHHLAAGRDAHDLLSWRIA